ncbi:hypothetical protein ACQKFO_21620 [Rossellomorea sp. NPDC071047]|uniref:hypothetical protein n=1 Tax=Rossellomorea sp. NPDC071047 TaxID=3390675 RepID=UPI003CFBC5A1
MSDTTRFRLYREGLRDVSFRPETFTDRFLSGLFNKFFSNVGEKYKITIPASIILRAELFCDDVTQESGIHFTFHDLMEILLEDFLRSIRRNPDPTQIYQGLKARDQRPPSINSYQEEESEYDARMSNKSKRVNIPITLDRRKSLKFEVFLADLEEIYPESPFYVEDVLEILLCDFIHCYKNGLLGQAFNEIVKMIKEEDEG